MEWRCSHIFDTLDDFDNKEITIRVGEMLRDLIPPPPVTNYDKEFKNVQLLGEYGDG